MDQNAFGDGNSIQLSSNLEQTNGGIFFVFFFIFFNFIYLFIYQTQIFQNTKYQVYTHLIWVKLEEGLSNLITKNHQKEKRYSRIYVYIRIYVHTQN